MFDRDSLTPSQRDAVTHGEGPLLVVAGAGTGKTRTLAARTAHLIASGVQPERILLLTFTRRAAREMLSRAARMVPGGGSAGRVWGGTFHAVANRLLRAYGRSVGVPSNFTILDQADTAGLMDLVRSNLELGEKRRRFPRKDTLAAIYSRTVNAQERLEAVLARSVPWCQKEADGIRSVFRGYTERKRAGGGLDFEDLLLYWRALVQAPGTGDRVGELFDHVLVDEYQDTNALQADILQAMRRRKPNITVVGDDAQAIYSFRAATVENILAFPEHFPRTRVVKLEQNFRSTQPLLDLSNSVIRQARRRHAKELVAVREGSRRPVLVTCFDDRAQSDTVCDRILRHREEGRLLRNQAVLFRTGHHSAFLEIELARRNIPFVKYGGLRFLEAAHVKDLLALLRILENPCDELAWFRVLQLLEGVGPAGARRAATSLGVGSEVTGSGRQADPDLSPLVRLIRDPPGVAPAAREDLERLRPALADCAPAGADPPPPAVQVERLRLFLDPVLARAYDDASSRVRDLEQLERMAAASATRGRFLVELTLDPPASTEDLAGPPLLDEDYLILSTIHSAKGCEWDVVHVIHAADGNIPSDMALSDQEGLEEERRLLYVALTRARDALYVYFPQRYYHRPRGLDDAHTYAQLTRFLTGAERKLVDDDAVGFEEEGQPGDRSPGAAPRTPVDVELSALWDG